MFSVVVFVVAAIVVDGTSQCGPYNKQTKQGHFHIGRLYQIATNGHLIMLVFGSCGKI